MNTPTPATPAPSEDQGSPHLQPAKKQSIFVKVLIALVVVFGGLAVFIAMQPNDFKVSRTVTMAVPADVVFEQVNDLHNWEAWSPYDKRDPAMVKTYKGEPKGVGASYHWNGNSEVGEGTSTIIESRPNELVRLRLDFERPFAGTNTAEFGFERKGDQTAVTWSLLGQYNFVTKALCLVMDMDKMIGNDFEAGLNSLKDVAERKHIAEREAKTAEALK